MNIIVKHKRTIFISVGTVLLTAILYLLFSYNYFYYHLGHAGLKWPQNQESYIIGKADKGITYSAIGDSLTSGVGVNNFEQSYSYLVAQSLANNNQIVILKNRSFPGFTVKDVVEQMLEPAIKDRPDIVTVFIGVNDTRGLMMPADFAKYYEQIISRLTQETSAKIYAINLPYLGAKTALLPPFNLLFDRITQKLNIEIYNITRKYNVAYIDLYNVTVKDYKNYNTAYSADGYHPSAEGYKNWAKLITDDIN